MRSRVHTFLYGRPSYLTFRNNAEYSNYNIVTKYGIFGMKVWMTQTTILKLKKS